MVEKRKHNRVEVDFTVSCRLVSESCKKVCNGQAINASSGGIYFITANCTCRPGSVVEISWPISPRTGQLQKPGKITGFCKLVRSERISGDLQRNDSPEAVSGAALEFCRSPKLVT